MKKFWKSAGSTFFGGLLVVVPLYLSVLLLLKAMQSVVGLVRPVAMLLPAWLPAEHALSLLLVIIAMFSHRCCRSHAGRASNPRAYREISFRKNPRLRTASEPDATHSRERRGARMEAGSGGD